jgi:hypothetical protein
MGRNVAMWYKKQKGEGGVFKNEYRVSNTVCIGSRDSLVPNLGGGSRWVLFSNNC